MNGSKKEENYNSQDIPLDTLQDNPYNVRKKYEDIESLAKSIDERGLQSPISVIKVNDYHVIVSGHRRTRAFRFLNRKTIPGIIRKKSNSTDIMFDLAVENLQRKDLYPIEIGITLEQLFNTIPSVRNNFISAIDLVSHLRYIDEKKIVSNLNEEDIKRAKNILSIVGIGSQTAVKYMKILSLPDNIQKNIILADNAEIPEGKIGLMSALQLARINSPDLQKQLSEKVMKEKLKSVQLKHVVDKIIKDDRSLAKSDIIRKESDKFSDLNSLTDNLNMLGSKIDGFRPKLSLVYGSFEKVELIASMERMKKSCMDMLININNIIRDNMKIEDRIKEVNPEFSNLEVTVGSDFRFNIPVKMAEVLEIKEGDVLLLKIENIKTLR